MAGPTQRGPAGVHSRRSIDHAAFIDLCFRGRIFAYTPLNEPRITAWDLFHYGYPEDLDLFSDEFVSRFSEYCYRAAKLIGAHRNGQPCYFTPVNEPSFLAWAGGDVGRFSPHCHGRGPELIRMPMPRISTTAPCTNHGTCFAAARFPNWQAAAAISISWGGNYYWTNQWEIGCEERPLGFDDPRRWPLAKLLRQVWKRYGGEFLITETSHVDDMRPIWLQNLADECEKLIDEGVPLRGASLYPILGMPEWHEPEVWTRMGLWDLVSKDGRLVRELYPPILDALRIAQRIERKFAEFWFGEHSSPSNRNAIVEPTGQSIELS